MARRTSEVLPWRSPRTLEEQHRELFPVRQLSDQGGDVVARRVHRARDVDHLPGPLASQVIEEGA